MIQEWRRIDRATLQELLADPDRVEDVLFPEDEPDEDDKVFDADKGWHGIHFLLTGSVWEGERPAADVVLGGRELGDADLGYGPARYLSPEEVAAVAAYLADVPPESLRGNFSPADMGEVYPAIWHEEAVLDDYVLPQYEELRQFYAAAAQAGDAMLLCIT